MTPSSDANGIAADGQHTLRDVTDQLAALRSVLAGLAQALPGSEPTAVNDGEARMHAVMELAAALPHEVNQRLAALADATFTGLDRSAVVRVHLTDACRQMTVELDPGAREVDPLDLAQCIEEAHAAAVEQFMIEQRRRQEWLEAAVSPVRKLLRDAVPRAGL